MMCSKTLESKYDTKVPQYVFAIDLYLRGLWVFLDLVFFWWKICPSLISRKRNFENRTLFGWSRAVGNDLPKIPCCNFADFELQKSLLQNSVQTAFKENSWASTYMSKLVCYCQMDIHACWSSESPQEGFTWLLFPRWEFSQNCQWDVCHHWRCSKVQEQEA